MTDELDLVSDYLRADDGAPTDLARARSILDDAIRAEVPPEPPEDRAPAPMRRPGRRSKVRSRLVVAGSAAVVASAVLIVQVVPTSGTHPPVAAAAQISRLADAVQPAPALQPGQWSSVQMTGEVLASIGTVGTTKTPDAQASIPLSFGVWSNATGTTCTSEQFGTATFASPDNAQAWQSIGLVATPHDQPVTGCVAGLQAALGGGMAMTPIDVSHLTRDPATLAEQLESGTTGVTSVDQSERGASGPQEAFARLTVLIVGPTSGAWSGYGQEMLQTMALLPGVISLGPMTAHSGRAGVAFSTANVAEVDPATGATEFDSISPVVILDVGTGALLEARNFSIPVLQSAGQDFVGSLDAPVYTEGVGYSVSTTWIDPVGGASVVSQAQLPAWISQFHAVEAVGNPNVGLQTMADVINQFVGNGNSLFSDTKAPSSDQTTFDLTITDPDTDVATVVAALTASGLFQSVVVKA